MRSLLLVLVCGVLLLGGCDQKASHQGRPVLVFGRQGQVLGRFMYPRAVVFAHDRYYIADKSGRIQIFSLTGEGLSSWKMPKWQAGKPVGLAVAPDGRIFVPDTHYARVLIFDPDGGLLDEFGSFGDEAGQFRLPTDIAFDDEGNIYVAEYGGNDRISKFTPEHEYLMSFADANSGEASTVRPQGLVWDPKGFLWVADAGHHRLCKFGKDGQFLGAFGHLGGGLGEMRFPYGLDRLPDGTLVVAEYGNNRIQRFKPTGESLGTWGKAGRNIGELATPWAVAVGPEDRLAVIDAGNNRVQVIEWRRDGMWDDGRE